MATIGSANTLGSAARFILELLLGLFVLGLLAIAWLPPESRAGSTKNVAGSNLLPLQGTSLVTITGSISPTDPTFTGQRHFRSNIPGDKNCIPFGQNGPRFYDQAFFLNSTSTAQRVSISFTSACNSNTFMAAYSPQFNPNDLCANFIASSGLSENVSWSFVVCPNSQFSIIVYGLEPLVTCSSYSYTVTSGGLIQLGKSSGKIGVPGPPDEARKFPSSDVTTKKVEPDDTSDAEVRNILPDALRLPLLPAQGTPLVTTVNDSIDGSEPVFVGQRHFRSGIIGDPSCSLFGVFGARPYDEVFFLNNSPTPQKVSVGFTSICGSNTYMVAYAPQFNPSSICANYIGGAGVSGNINWEFTICPNSIFSIVVYGLEPGFRCAGYSYKVFAEGVMLIGTPADVSITKSAPLGSVSAGENLPYTIIIRNNGPSPASGITFTDILPPSTTFSSLALISGFGSPLPTSMCTTPPIGSNGTITCSGLSLTGPGSASGSFLAVLLSVNVSPRSSSSISNTATVSHPGFDPNLSNNSATATTMVTGIFDLCLQDDGDPAKVLFINSITGDYRFCCRGVVGEGRGKITIHGSIYTLEDNSSGRRLLARDDESTHSGSAILEMPQGTVSCSIVDRNTTNNRCTCP